MRCQKPGSVRLIFADPPYNIGIDYGRGSKADSLPEAVYLTWCQEWLNACLRLLTDDGSLWVMINDEYADHFGLLLRKTGLHRRAWIKWYETFGVNCTNNFNRCSRHIFYCVKTPGGLYLTQTPSAGPRIGSSNTPQARSPARKTLGQRLAHPPAG